MTSVLPVVDISRFHAGAKEREALLAEIRYAAHEVGFFYVTGHGVPAEVPEAALAASRAFFALPEEQRLAIDNLHSPQFRGYTRVGDEHTNGRPDRRDQIDLGDERAARTLGPGDPAYLRLIGPNQWPEAVPEFRPAALAWLAEAERVSKDVLRALGAALGQPDDYFDRWFDDEAMSHAKFVRYPGRGDAPDDQGVGAHKDYGFLALLHQDGYGGLYVEVEPGREVEAVPIPGAFVFNIGEVLEIATQGYLRATRHRVVSPRGDDDRYSLPYFLAPRLDAVIEQMPLPAELAAQARGIEDDPDNPLLAEYGWNALKGWLRAHPRVAQRWWADVLASA